jgi:four helix bundle protein
MFDAMPTVKRLVDQIRVHDRNLADQVKRAATSVVLNHAEADGVRGGQRRMRVETAQGSLAETQAGLRVAGVRLYITERDAEQVDAMLDAVAAATYRRLHPRR